MTDYRLHGVTINYQDQDTKLSILVGKSERIADITLTDREVIELISRLSASLVARGVLK